MTTARYGDGSLYGQSGLTYGVNDPGRSLTWVFEVDWDNDGLFDGSNEAGNIYDIQTENGRLNFLNGSGDGFEPVKVGTITLQLRNNDGRYDPYNVDGPLYGSILPGRKFNLRVFIEATSTYQPVMKGRIDDIRPVYSGNVENVRITGSNGIKEMKKGIKTGIYTNERFDTALAVLLANWTDGTDIDTAISEQMSYWWASGNPMIDEIMSIADAALGMFCVREDGKATYISRVASDLPLVSITGEDIELDYGIRTPTLWDVVRNIVRVHSRKRTLQTNVELWRSGDVYLVPANSSVTIWASFSYNGDDGVSPSVTNPVATTDYTAFANADGTGTNLTANISITTTAFATSAKQVVRNTGGTDAYMTLHKIRGNAIVADKYTYVEDQDDTSIAEFGELEFNLKSDWLQDVNTATSERDILLSRLASARQFPRVKLKPNPDIQFALRLFGLAQVGIASRNISGEFRTGYIRHKSMDETLQSFETEVYFEPNLLGNTSGSWIFPATFGVTTVF